MAVLGDVPIFTRVRVKQIMEEAVTRKFVHEDSSHIVSFCAAVEACVLHGLKRRAAGFLRSNKIAALFMKVGKSFAPAEELCRKAQELEQITESKRNQSLPNQDSLRILSRLPSLSPQVVRNLWIRTALIEKVLDKIVLYLVENSSKFYEKEAILMDPVDGPILASLLVGPCALEYTKMKTADHFWTDPSADELVQRHRIHSGHCRQDSPTKRPALCRAEEGSQERRPAWFHFRKQILKLISFLALQRDDMEAIPGYLSLHQTAHIMTLKWTPNQLMNGSVGDLDYEHSVYWDYAMTIRLEEIVYLHCHQQVDTGGTVVLVSQDGIQRPPLRFPRGGHLLQFLSCLENGLLPHGRLDPPLWSQRGKGKVFPKLRNRCSQGSSDSVSDKEEDEATDYVFHILPLIKRSLSPFLNLSPSWTIGGRLPGHGPSNRKNTVLCRGTQWFTVVEKANFEQANLAPELMDQEANIWQPTTRKSSCSSCTQCTFSDGGHPNGCNHERAPLKLLCDQMKYQIISRAFYGWLAYCRHLSTVRTHLSALVNHTIVAPDAPGDALGGLTAEVWQRFLQDCTAYKEQELLRLVYFGGVDPSLRKEVWPFLLGHYQFGMTEADRKEVDEQVRACYEQTMSEWLGCEAIVRQREKEQHAAALAKCSSISASVDNPSTVQRMMHRDSSISNESSQSCSSDRQSLARLQSDSDSSTQVFESVEEVEQIETEPKSEEAKPVPKIPNGGGLPNVASSPDSGHPSSRNFSVTSGMSDHSLSIEDSTVPDTNPKTTISAPPQLAPAQQIPVNANQEELEADDPNVPPLALQDEKDLQGLCESSGVRAALSEGSVHHLELRLEEKEKGKTSPDGTESIMSEELEMESLFPKFEFLTVGGELKISPVPSIGTTYSQELLDMYTINLHRIEKDVQRCDRNYWYFTPANLEKLRNIMCSYIWQHLEIGYVQGMCDLLAPLLVILDDEAMAFSCFTELMKRMNQNFPHGRAMDTHFANMRSLIQILDSEIFELMHQNGDYTHFYFCYRWFLLDLKRELVYDDVFAVWETIWAAKHASSGHFVLFIALALVEVYRDIILENNMDFTDIIKFFNEMAEHHNIKQILTLARDLVCKVQTLIENK
uniref:Small G protein signaling modulator 1 n=1 Tax=Hucho hucho TaxID=62062 RepID=A0A4W5L0Y0_9TELE